MKFSRITGGEQRKDGIHVKWKVISIANCEFENEKKEGGNTFTRCVKISKEVSFLPNPGTFL